MDNGLPGNQPNVCQVPGRGERFQGEVFGRCDGREPNGQILGRNGDSGDGCAGQLVPLEAGRQRRRNPFADRFGVGWGTVGFAFAREMKP